MSASLKRCSGTRVQLRASVLIHVLAALGLWLAAASGHAQVPNHGVNAISNAYWAMPQNIRVANFCSRGQWLPGAGPAGGCQMWVCPGQWTSYICWSPEHGAFPIYGTIAAGWSNYGPDEIGYPVHEERLTADGQGRYQYFSTGEGIYVHWRQPGYALRVKGAILDSWAANGYESGRFGWPRDGSELVARPGSTTCRPGDQMQSFDGPVWGDGRGFVACWNPVLGVYWVNNITGELVPN